jgi:hypothetical protein
MVSKKPILFLGSGASVPFGLPTTIELRKRLKSKYRPKTSHTFDAFISSFLEFEGFQDIEHVLQCLHDLYLFADTYGGRYLFDTEKGRGTYTVYGYQETLMDLLSNSINVKRIMEDEVYNHYSRDNLKVNDLNFIFNSIFETIKGYSAMIEVFTTNYDVAVEEYLENNSIMYADGFKLHPYKKRFLWDPTIYNDPESTVRVYKLHGSLNWKEHRKHGIEKTTTQRKAFEPDYTRDLIVYPTISPKEGSSERTLCYIHEDC